ncbi:MAG: hypothetical protein ACJ746_19215 [Bryobacteraceae bacterium]
MTSGRCATSLAWIMLSAAVSGADLDGPVIAQMRVAVPGFNQVRVVTRVQAAPKLDLVVTLAGGNQWPPGQNHRFWWDENRILGIFLQRRDSTGTVYKIAIQKGPGDCEGRVERATATDLVMSCRPEKGDLRGLNHKFVYNVHSKALAGQLEYQPFSMPRLFVSGETPVLVGSDRKTFVVLQFDALNDQNPFHLLTGPAAERWTERVNAMYGLDRFGPGSEQVVDVPARPFRTLHFGPDARFSLVRVNR